MLKKLLLGIAGCFALIGLAFAQVDVNKADQAALDGVKGIGPSISKRIVDERQAHGPFKDWSDFEKRVKGIGDKKAAALSQAGLTVNGQALANAPAAATGAKPAAGAAGTQAQPAAKAGGNTANPFNAPAGSATSGKSGAPAAGAKP